MEPTKGEVTCANCGKVFTKGWSDEEALKELGETFPDFEVEDCAVICDDCYKAMGFGDD